MSQLPDWMAQDLGRESLSEEEMDWLLEKVDCTAGATQAASLYYRPPYYSGVSIAAMQGCTRGPVVRRLQTWRQRARALLEERDRG